MTQLPDNAAEVLTGIARRAITHRAHLRPSADAPALPDEPWLKQPGAVFVTLNVDGRLRGCIGSLEAYRPLGEDVAANAVAASSRDLRFVEVEPEELDDIDIEVSVLSAPERITFTSKEDALAQLRPGIDGVILAHGNHRATFLPQVWEKLDNPEEFMALLMRKAGLRFDFWADDIELSRYTVTPLHES